jgi:hypothetical protein
MITKKDAIAIGKEIVAGCKKEQDNNYNEQNISFALNGAALRGLENLWYNVFTNKLKEQFGYQFESYKAHVTV